MGGRAFLEILPGAKFPRMDPSTYQLLKTRHFEQLRQKFRLVGVPRESPEKVSHGDIDYVVCSPLDSSSSSEDLKNALGAVHCIPDDHTLNLAIPLHDRNVSTFYQVDINQCQDEGVWERTIFFHGYGDLGMILGLIARSNGLSLGLHGLKVPSIPEYNMPPFVLSASFPRILDFFGLDLAAWEAGFPCLQTAFQWAASSRFFDPSIIKESPSRENRMKDRDMFQKFLSWVKDQEKVLQPNGKSRPALQSKKIVEEAMAFFETKEEYESLMESKRKRREIKDKFNGHLVMQWTGMQGKSVRVLMNEVRKNVDEEMLHRLTREEINTLVLKVQEKMSM